MAEQEKRLLFKSNRIGLICIPREDGTFIQILPGVNIVEGVNDITLLKLYGYDKFFNKVFEGINAIPQYEKEKIKAFQIKEIKEMSDEIIKEALDLTYNKDVLEKLNQPSVVSDTVKPYVSAAIVGLKDKLEASRDKEREK